MQSLASVTNIIFGILTIAAQILSVALIVAHFSPSFRSSAFARFFSDKSILIVFIISLLATLGSLTYSDILGYTPCKLCWFQRIFMYPQVVLAAIALWKRDTGIRIYALWLLVFGAAFALFHYVGQLGFNPLGLDCLAVGYSTSCSKNFVLQFGYITIPLMTLSAFVLAALSLSLSIKRDKESLAPTL